MEKDTWNKLVLENKGEFLQSYQWGEFQESLGKKIERIKGKNFLAQVIFNPLIAGLNYAYIPRGPVLMGDNIEREEFFNKLSEVSSKKTVFFEIEAQKPIKSLAPLKKEARQPLKTLFLDLTKEDNEMFSSFHKTLRYHIRLAERKGVKIKNDSSPENFLSLLPKTSTRQKFKNWPDSYYKKLWQTLAPYKGVEVLSAYKDNKLISSNLYVFFGSRVTYLYGCSDYNKRQLMAPHLLHWEAIKKFKNEGFKEYDFWGLDDKKFPGVTIFKKRFGGEIYNYPGSYVKINNGLCYGLYKLKKKWV